MPYSRRLVHYMAEARLGVAFHRAARRDDGTPGDPQHWAHADGGWDSTFDPARHVRPLDRAIPEVRPNFQCFAVPIDVVESPDAFATIHSVDQAGAIASDVDMLNAGALRGFAGGPIAVPG